MNLDYVNSYNVLLEYLDGNVESISREDLQNIKTLLSTLNISMLSFLQEFGMDKISIPQATTEKVKGRHLSFSYEDDTLTIYKE